MKASPEEPGWSRCLWKALAGDSRLERNRLEQDPHWGCNQKENACLISSATPSSNCASAHSENNPATHPPARPL